MPTLAQVNYVKARKELIQEPILIVGSKLYDYDRFDFRSELTKMGYCEITGIDLQPGQEVDYPVDLCDSNASFYSEHACQYKTIICMSVLMCVPNPFVAAENLTRVSAPQAVLFLSEPFIHKHTNMPKDYWRFTTNSFKAMFKSFLFQDAHFKMVITRSDAESEYNPNRVMVHPYTRNSEETAVGYILRKINRKLLSKSIFRVPLFPEVAIYALGKKEST